MGPNAPPTPALLKMQSRPWKRWTARATRPATWSSVETSPWSTASRTVVALRAGERDGLGEPRLVQVADHHPGALAKKRERGGAPDAAAAPGDDRDLAVEPPAHPRLPLAARLHPGLGPGQASRCCPGDRRASPPTRCPVATLPLISSWAARAGKNVLNTPIGRSLKPGGALSTKGSMQSYQDIVTRASTDSTDSVALDQGPPCRSKRAPIDRDRRVREGGEEQGLDGLLQPARHRDVVAVDADPPVGERALEEQRVAAARRAPQHPPVARAVGQRLAAVGAQPDEGVLAGHHHLVRVNWRHRSSPVSGVCGLMKIRAKRARGKGQALTHHQRVRAAPAFRAAGGGSSPGPRRCRSPDCRPGARPAPGVSAPGTGGRRRCDRLAGTRPSPR